MTTILPSKLAPIASLSNRTLSQALVSFTSTFAFLRHPQESSPPRS